MSHMRIASLSAALAGATVHLVEHASLRAKELVAAIEREDFYSLVVACPDDVTTVFEKYGRELVELAYGIRAANELPELARKLVPVTGPGTSRVGAAPAVEPAAPAMRTEPTLTKDDVVGIIAQAAGAISTMNDTHGLTPPATEAAQ